MELSAVHMGADNFSGRLTSFCPFFILQGNGKGHFSRMCCRNHVFPGGAMCDLNAYIYQEGKEELYLENVNSAKSEEGKVYLRNLFGEQKVFEGIIQEISLSGHRILLTKG